MLERVKTDHIKRHYQIAAWSSALDFLEKLAKRTGKLLKGGDPDTVAVGKMVLNDWQRGKLQCVQKKLVWLRDLNPERQF